MRVEVAYSGEGATDAAIARRLIVAAGGLPGIDFVSRRRSHGKNALDRSIQGLNIAAKYRPVLVLRDLDQDADCPSQLACLLVAKPANGLCLRIAVRSAEVWLMADRINFAKAAGLRLRELPKDPENLTQPKAALVRALRTSTRPELRRMVADRVEGQLLAGFLVEFARADWNPVQAVKDNIAPSLSRALMRLTQLIATAR